MMNITPFSTFNTNFQKPFDHRYETPVYDPTDIVGDFDDDGNPIGDGTPDNPGNILYYQKNYSGTNKDSYSLGTGITLNFSVPLDRQYTRQCKEAAQVQNDINKLVEQDDSIDKLLVAEDNNHPLIIKLWMQEEILLETIVILDSLTGFVDKENEKISETIIWPDIYRKIKKYSPFVKFDRTKCLDLLKKTFTNP